MNDDFCRVPASWDENILIAAGARTIAEVREGDPGDGGMVPLIGYDVSPPISKEQYDAAVKAYKPPVVEPVASAAQMLAALKQAGMTDDAVRTLANFAATLKATT